ncbi:MAG: hypothetical protein A2Y24_07840 [Clostridiales bacterium GWE2_32_10]|nr:MAG: hypothetical protein A2Y24_07840 [Clostridiales bacterium GWE2_32_10]HBY21369.1 hypothetical protein [Clostridiales bacterium]
MYMKTEYEPMKFELMKDEGVRYANEWLKVPIEIDGVGKVEVLETKEGVIIDIGHGIKVFEGEVYSIRASKLSKRIETGVGTDFVFSLSNSNLTQEDDSIGL